MKATELLKKQHEDVTALFDKLEAAEDGAEKRDLFDEIAANLVAHDAIERQIFYPACEKKMGLTDTLGEALVEHGLVELCIARADQNRSKKTFDHFIKVLRDVVDHHVEEEEDELFPKVEKAFDAAELQALATKMKEKFDDAVGEDWRGPLEQNLAQVLAGAEKTSPNKKKAAARANGSGKRASARAS